MDKEKFREREVELVESPEVSDNSKTELSDEDLHAGKISFAQKVLGDKFEVLDVLGTGGMGSVYKVKDTATDRVVALKLLKPELCQDKSVLKRFQQEAASLAELQHQNIVSVYDHGITGDGAPYLVMQYLGGETLADRLKAGKMTPEQVAVIALQICHALEYAHKRKLVHRDIKPSNVIITESGDVQLLDFGIAKILETTPGNTTNLTQTGDVFGTPAYMSPEQCQGEDVDWRSDIYSAGCVLYEMLTGKQPFEGANPIQVAVKHINAQPERFAEDLPDGDVLLSMEQIVLRCMRKDKETRYQTISELIDDLRLVKSGKQVAYAEESEEALSKAKNKSRVVAVGNFFGGMVASLFYLWFLFLLGTFVNDTSALGLAGYDRSNFILVAIVGLCLHTRRAYQMLTTMKKRHTFLDWCERVVFLAMMSAYLLSGVSAIPSLPGFLVDVLTLGAAVSIVTTCTVFIMMIVVSYYSTGAKGIGALAFLFKKINNPSHTAVKQQAVPMSFRRAAKRIGIASVAMVLVFVVACPTATSQVTRAFGYTFARFGSSLAQPTLQLALALDRGNTGAAENLADLVTAHGDPNKAIDIISSSIIDNPEAYDLYLKRAEIKHQILLDRDALVDLNKALQLMPDSADALLERGRVYTAMGDFNNARIDLSKALNLHHYSASAEDIYTARGLTYFAQGNYKAAIVDFSYAVEQGYSHRMANYVRRAMSYAALGDQASARQNYQLAFDSYYSDESHQRLIKAFAAKQLGDLNESKALLKGAEDAGAKQSDLKNLILPNLPLVTLGW